MSTATEYDVAVVGGGPAGSTAAKTVRDYSDDMDVVLFDEGTKRADRGDQIGPDSTDAAGQVKYWLADMPEWVVDIFLQNKIKNIDRAEFHGPTASTVIRRASRFEQFVVPSIPSDGLDVDLDSFGMTFDRPGLDDDLVAAARDAGVDIRMGARVSSVETDWHESGLRHHLTVPRGEDVVAEYLVLADGPKRTVTIDAIGQFLDGEQERVAPANQNQHVARQFYVEPPADATWTDGLEHAFAVFWGHVPGHTAYPWVFPLEEGVYEIGLTRPAGLDRPDVFEGLDVDPREWPLLDPDDTAYPGDEEILRRFYTRTLSARGDLTDHTVGNRGKFDGKETYVISSMRPFDSPTDANIAVVGGAGGFTSAFHEGGDHVAVYTGSLAGELIGDDTQSLTDYNGEWKRRYGYEIFPNVAFARLVEDFTPGEYDTILSALVGETAPSTPTELAFVLKSAYKFGRLRVSVGEDLPLTLKDYVPERLVNRVWQQLVDVTPPMIQESDYRIDPPTDNSEPAGREHGNAPVCSQP